MIRGTTPTLEFTLPFDTGLLAEAWVTVSQLKREVFTKELEECSRDGNKLSVTLTQEETLKLECSHKTEIQVRVRTADGTALASQIIAVNTERILRDGVI